MKKFRTFAVVTALMTVLSCSAVNVSAEYETDCCEEIRLATNEELEQLVITERKLGEFISENGYTDISAYASLQWYKHSVQLYVKDSAVHDKAVQFIEENGIENSLVDIVISPEYDFTIPCGGGKENEVNTIVADEYFAVKDFLNENSYPSNIFLTNPSQYVTMIEVYVKDNKAAEALEKYMSENYFWRDVVDIKITPDLAPLSNNTIKNKAFVIKSGDMNDDGRFNISDIVLLQKYLIGANEINERQAVSADILKDDSLDVFDLVFAKRKLLTE